MKPQRWNSPAARVFNALSSVTPKTVKQLSEETGLSESTVRKHLDGMKARWIPTGDLAMGWLRPEEKRRTDPVWYWRHERAQVAERIRVLTISESANPVELADEFLSIGRQLLEIGEAIDRVKMDPDWYQRLGGHFWLSDGEGKMQ